jgi:predicted dehydrogenase
MRRLGVGLIGLGRWGRNYLRTLARLPDCSIKAVADRDPSALAGIPPELRAFSSHRALLDHPEVEAVVIASPDETHYELARASLAAGRDVLVEKPMATNVRDAEALVELSLARGLVLLVGHTMLYHRGFDRLQQSVVSGSIGRIARLTAVRTSSGVAHRRTTVLQDLVPHDLAMAIVLLGTPVAARARAGRKAATPGLSYQLLFPGDVVLSGWAAWRTPPHVRRLRVSGTGGVAVFTDSPIDPDIGHWGLTIGDCPDETPLGRQCRDFIGSSLHRATPASDGRQGLLVTRSVAALAGSQAAGGAWMPVNPALSNPGTGIGTTTEATENTEPDESGEICQSDSQPVLLCVLCGSASVSGSDSTGQPADATACACEPA